MTAVIAAWLLLSLVLFVYAARVLIADLREGHGGRSWCLDCRDGLTGCDCVRVPEQRNVSGRF